jgi:hypothetical protein
MAELPQEKLHRLLAGPVPRADIATVLGTMDSVSLSSSGEARSADATAAYR